MKMKRLLSCLLVLVLLLAMAPTALAAKDGIRGDYYYFTDRYGTEMKAPLNAFATSVISFEPGKPWTVVDGCKNPENVLGITEYCYTLGAGGVLVLGFDVAICDGEGIDIYVFEMGNDVEATKVEVSNNLKTWYEVGVAEGKTAGVDLEGKVPEGTRYRYVRLTDLRSYPRGEWPGADITAVSGLNVTAAADDWAYKEIDQKLVPDDFPTDWTKPITRKEFAAVCVQVYENLSGTKAKPAAVNPFTDCSDREVLKAYNVGITNGTSPTTFGPDLLLSREQAATMLARVFKCTTMEGWTLATDSSYPLSYTMPAKFADDASISGWAKDSVYFMVANNILKGVGNNMFAPRNLTSKQEAEQYANATRQQALVIATRMVQNLS